MRLRFLPLKRKTELNLIAWLTPQFPDYDLLPGRRYGIDTEIRKPAIIISADSFTPQSDIDDDDVGTVTVSLSVITDTREQEHIEVADQLLASLMELLMDERTPEFIRTWENLPQPDWYVYEINHGGDDTEFDGDDCLDTIKLEFVCHALPAAA